MSIIKAHFDGKTFVPDEPVDLPAGEQVEITLPHGGRKTRDPERARRAWERFKSHAVSGLNIPDEALRRENMYEEKV